MIKKLPLILGLQLLCLCCVAQNTVSLKNTMQTILVSKSATTGAVAYSQMPITFKLSGKPTQSVIEKKLTVKIYNAGMKPKFIVGTDMYDEITIKIPSYKFNAEGTDVEYTTQLVLGYTLPAPDLKEAEHVFITSEDGGFVDLLFQPDTIKSKAVVKKLNSIYVLPGDTTLYPVLADSTLLYNDHKLKVLLKLDAAAGQITPPDTVVKFKIDDSQLKSKYPLIVEDVQLTKRNVSLLNAGDTISVDVPLKNFSLTKLKKPVNISLSTLSNPSSRYGVKVSNVKQYNSSNQFWIELGTNFDLLDGLEANNLYGGVIMFVKDIAGKKANKRWSFVGGFYESKSTSFSNSSDSGFVYRDASSVKEVVGKGFPYYRASGSVKAITDVKSVGLVFSPFLRLTHDKSEADGFHLYTSVYIEMLWQRLKTTYDYTKTVLDTSTLYEATLGAVQYKHNFKESTIDLDFRSHYLGAGLPIYIKHKNYNFFLNSVIGMTTQEFVAVQTTREGGLNPRRYVQDPNTERRKESIGTNTFYTPFQHWNPFYLFNFRLNEDNTGISFTGEVRGFFIKDSKPVISFALSKKFNLEDVFAAIVKPFTPKTP